MRNERLFLATQTKRLRLAALEETANSRSDLMWKCYMQSIERRNAVGDTVAMTSAEKEV